MHRITFSSIMPPMQFTWHVKGSLQVNNQHLTIRSHRPDRSSRWHPVCTLNKSVYAQTGSSTCKGPLENATYEIGFSSIAMPGMSCSFTWLVCEMGGKQLYRCSFVAFCFQDLFKTAHSIVFFPSNFFSSCFVRVQIVHLYSITDTAIIFKKSLFLLQERSDFLMID